MMISTMMMTTMYDDDNYDDDNYDDGNDHDGDDQSSTDNLFRWPDEADSTLEYFLGKRLFFWQKRKYISLKPIFRKIL